MERGATDQLRTSVSVPQNTPGLANATSTFARPEDRNPAKPALVSDYHVLKLQRTSLAQPWGLALSFLQNRLIVGSVNSSHSPMVKSHWAVRNTTNPWIFWREDQPAPLRPTTFVGCLAAGGHGYWVNDPSILPGDCILAINNVFVRDFRTLDHITSLFKGLTSVELIILRHPEAATVAALASADGPSRTNRINAVYISLPEPASPAPKRPPPYRWPTVYRNPLFKDSKGVAIQYSDNADEWDPEEGCHARNFLPEMNNFSEWLSARKSMWRQRYEVHHVIPDVEEEEYSDRFTASVALDFWKASSDIPTFDDWLATRKVAWKTKYSWNKRKRQMLEEDVDRPVNLNTDEFCTWLRVRKNQWKVQLRKRQRMCSLRTPILPSSNAAVVTPESSVGTVVKSIEEKDVRSLQPEILFIDAMLEEQERQRKSIVTQPPLDIRFLFDASLGCPDDVVVHILRFLRPVEHCKMLGISSSTRNHLMERGEVFRQLCPEHWTLPRRPRKPWHEFYLSKLEKEITQSRKVLDEVLVKASQILLKGDQLLAIEKLVHQAERDCDNFDVNYSSGVVCERNSILNLATIHQRTKVVKWLVEHKGADIETADRGQFTPLLNAAWAGDRYLVRYFMSKGSNRKQIGRAHYTKPLALPDFEGLTAEGWALKRRHVEIAKLIRLGL